LRTLYGTPYAGTAGATSTRQDKNIDKGFPNLFLKAAPGKGRKRHDDGNDNFTAEVQMRNGIDL